MIWSQSKFLFKGNNCSPIRSHTNLSFPAFCTSFFNLRFCEASRTFRQTDLRCLYVQQLLEQQRSEFPLDDISELRQEVKQKQRTCSQSSQQLIRNGNKGAPELTGFHRIHKEKIEKAERRWRSGSPDKALVPESWKALQSHESLWGGHTTISKPRVGFSPWHSNAKKEIERRRKRPSLALVRRSASHSAVSIQISTLVSLTAISNFQRWHERTISKLRSVFSIVRLCAYKRHQNLRSLGFIMEAHKYEMHRKKQKHPGLISTFT